MAAPSRAGCPAEDLLFRFFTGEVPRWRRTRLRRHVNACPACAAQLRGWDETTTAYRDYFRSCVPNNPSEDGAERVRVARFEARLRREPSSSTPSSRRLTPFVWRSLAAAALLIACGSSGILPLQETITADALVARAVANEQECPCPSAAMVTIAPRRQPAAVVATSTSARYGLMPDGAMTRGAMTHGLMSERGATARELAGRLADYAFDWSVPLSARPYQAWRAATTARTESYDWMSSDRVRVSTRATSGRIERAELILRTSDYRAVGQTWRFTDGFEVELRLSERGAPASAAGSTLASSTLSRVETSAATTLSSIRSVEEAEIAFRLSLERAGIVLTRQMTLRRARASDDERERLVIAGRAASRDVARIDAAAREIGGIAVNLRSDTRRMVTAEVNAGARGARARGAGADGAGAGATSAVDVGLEAWLERTFGDSPSHAAFVPTARELHERLEDAVAALDGLRLLYPASDADRLSTAARDDFRQVTAAYYARVVVSYERLEAHLAPLTGSVSRRMLAAAPPADWRVMPVRMIPATRNLSTELAALTALAPSSAADDFERLAGARVRAALVAVVPR
jgi:hypothetical protein